MPAAALAADPIEELLDTYLAPLPAGAPVAGGVDLATPDRPDFGAILRAAYDGPLTTQGTDTPTWRYLPLTAAAPTLTRATLRLENTTTYQVGSPNGFVAQYAVTDLVATAATTNLTDYIWQRLESNVTQAYTQNVIGTTAVNAEANYFQNFLYQDQYYQNANVAWENNWPQYAEGRPAPKPLPGVSKRALARAKRLIKQHLTDAQLEMLAAKQYFELESSSGKRYRIYRGHSMNVYRLDDEGREIERLCAYSKTPNMPDDDHILIQKLHLETDEEAFRKVANKADLRPRGGSGSSQYWTLAA